MSYKLCIVGGAGHIGLPLGVAFANRGLKTVLFDVNKEVLDKIKKGTFPFKEEGGNQALKQAFKKNKLFLSDSPQAISDSDYIIIVIGTPIDKYLNPDFKSLIRLIKGYDEFFKDGQIVILRSTVYPGTSEKIQRYFKENKKNIKVAFCPERIVEGKAFAEFKNLPQIISAFDKSALKKVENLFRKISNRPVVYLEPQEAELAKLFSNSWRYIKFAVANQFFTIAHDYDLNYLKIDKAMKYGYERNQDLPSPGFSAGPCLYKDTMQLSSFNRNNFFLGHSAMLINEGLPNFIIQTLKRKIDLKHKVIGLLGMTFKAESDDIRDSLSYKLKKIAEIECLKVLCHDFYVQDPNFVSLPELLREADIIILTTPHKKYKKINISKYKHKKIIDIWGFWGESHII